MVIIKHSITAVLEVDESMYPGMTTAEIVVLESSRDPGEVLEVCELTDQIIVKTEVTIT